MRLMRRRLIIAVTAAVAGGCFKFTQLPKTLEGSPKPTYRGKCPVRLEPLTTASIEADAQPYAAWQAPDADLKREMAEVPDEFNRMAKGCDALAGPSTAALKVSVRKAAFTSHKPSTFTYEVTDGTGAVVHAFSYTSELDWNPFIQSRLQASYLCSFVSAACDDKLE